MSASSSTSAELGQLRSAWAAVSVESEAAVKKAVTANQKLIDQVAARRKRAEDLTAIFKTELIQLESEAAEADARTKELEQQRRELSEASRKIELEAYQHRRRLSVTNEKEALYHRQLSTSHVSAQSARALSGMFQQDKPLDEAAAARRDFDDFTRRAEAAKQLAGELQRECDENEAMLSRKLKERHALVTAIDELQQSVSQLERNELVVEDAVRHTHHLLRTAGATHHEIPTLQRAIRSNEARIAELKAERESLVAILMRLVEKDDEKIRQLHMTSLRSAGSNAMPTVIRDLTSENEAFQKLCFDLIEEADKERVRLEGTASAIAEKLSFVENKIKLKVPSASH